MPSDLRRFHHSGQTHFVTFTCYHRYRYFTSSAPYGLLLLCLEAMRRRFRMSVYGFVVMPEHVHLLLSEPKTRYYDRNVRDAKEFTEKLRYLHRNPVKRGLVCEPGEWKWSSFRHYMHREMGPVEIESEWTARDRETKKTGGPARIFLTPR